MKPNVLSQVILPELIGDTKAYGMDTLARCVDKNHFRSFPHTVEYSYNSRGFRDDEWPSSRLDKHIWCLGDSFTVGVGSPFNHTWPQVLKRISCQPVINVSMDGGSNEWLTRMCTNIYNEIHPRNMVIMWSFLHRRENPDISLSDRQRRLPHIRSTLDEDIKNLIACVRTVDTLCVGTNVIHTIIPIWEAAYAPPVLSQTNWDNIRDSSWPLNVPISDIEYVGLEEYIRKELTTVHGINEEMLFEQFRIYEQVTHVKSMVHQVEQLDYARDGLHFDIITAERVSHTINEMLVNTER